MKNKSLKMSYLALQRVAAMLIHKADLLGKYVEAPDQIFSPWQRHSGPALTWMLPSSFRERISDTISSVHPGATEISTAPFIGSMVRIVAIPS
jgi:hypothetical protein